MNSVRNKKVVWYSKSADKREAYGLRMRMKYPERVPVMMLKCPEATCPDIVMTDLILVRKDFLLSQFLALIRRRIEGLRPETSIYLFINNVLPQLSKTMGELYEQHHEHDYVMYIGYSDINVHRPPPHYY